jgi:hypothetical protein
MVEPAAAKMGARRDSAIQLAASGRSGICGKKVFFMF